MNEENKDIINKYLLIGDKFMPEMYLWDPKVKTYSACGPVTRHKQRINDFMKDGKLSHIAKNRLDAACFQLVLEDLEDLELKIKYWLIKFINQLLKTLKEEKCILVLKIIFGVLTWLTCH